MKDKAEEYLLRTKDISLDVPPKNFRGKDWLTTDVTLRSNICYMRKHLENNYFLVLVIVGPPGEGKSTFAGQIGWDIDPTFNEDRMCRVSKEFSDQLYHCSEVSAINFDEGALGLLSREAMQNSNRILAKSFMIARAKKLLLMICIPDYFMLDKFIRSNMVNGLFVIPKRGRWNYYNGRQARAIGKIGNFFGFHARMRGKFGKELPFEKEYLSRKMMGIKTVLKEAAKEGLLSPPQAARASNLSVTTIMRAVYNGGLPAEKQGSVTGRTIHWLIKPADLNSFVKKVEKNKLKLK